MTSSKPKKLVPGPYSTTWSYISLAYNKNMADEEKYLYAFRRRLYNLHLIQISALSRLIAIFCWPNLVLDFGSGFRALVPVFIPSQMSFGTSWPIPWIRLVKNQTSRNWPRSSECWNVSQKCSGTCRFKPQHLVRDNSSFFLVPHFRTPHPKLVIMH